jgi:hypothetical protein
MKGLFSAVLIGLATAGAIAQNAIPVPFTSERWYFHEYTARPGPKEHVLEEYLGRPSLRLRATEAILQDANFTNGIIEYDAAFPPDRGGIGLNFRMQDSENTEFFYIRPHQSGNPDATQYMPVFQNRDSWQLYHADGYSAPVTFTYNQWVHFKLVVSDRQMEVFIDDMDKPALFVPELKRPVQGGKLALVGAARFANFSYTPLDKPAFKSTAKPAAPAPAGMIPQWQVSNTFAAKDLENAVKLPDALKKGLQWQTMPAEPTGMVNLATGPKWSKETNTTFARVVLVSDKAQVKKMQFGFSDRVKVYLNDQILYSGHDEFRSRDYRFLGTVGYFDELYLQLKPGPNELWIAVSEDNGGWGIGGIIADRTGLTIAQP